MLESLAVILKIAFEIVLMIVLFISVAEKSGAKKFSSLIYGILVSFTLAWVIIYWLDFFKDRELFDAALGVITSLVAIMVCFISKKYLTDDVKENVEHGVVSFLVIATCILVLTLAKAIEVELFVSNIFVMNKVINSDFILKLSGVLLASIISLIAMLVLLKVKKLLTSKALLRFIYLFVFVIVFRNAITIFQTLFATGIIPLKPWALAIISPLINTYYPMMFYLIFGATFVIWYLTKFSHRQNKPNLAVVANPAQKRKLLSRYIKENNWIIALCTILIIVLFVLSGKAVMANRKDQIDPPIPVKAENGVINIPLKELEDYNLHRFSYTTASNIVIRFIVIRKGDKIYGSGLDACDICGNAGYYQRGKDIICKNCDVVMNIATIGFPGGCNPIPLKNKNNGKEVSINIADLESKQEVFAE